MSLRRLAIAVPLSLAAIVLAGCSFTSHGFAALDSEREAADELPPLEDYAYEPVEVSSSRFVGEHEGTSLWIAWGKDQSSVCLIAVPNDGNDDWTVGCGGGGIGMSGGSGTFEVVPDGLTPPGEMTRISENVYAE